MLFSQEDKMRIMVLDFGGSGVEASLLIAAYEDLETKLIETNRFIVIDRSTRESRIKLIGLGAVALWLIIQYL